MPTAKLLLTIWALCHKFGDGKIVKPMSKWVCDYCSMGNCSINTYRLRSKKNNLSLVSLVFHKFECPTRLHTYLCAGPQLDPEDCGTPVFCLFFLLLGFIMLLTAYTTLCKR